MSNNIVKQEIKEQLLTKDKQVLIDTLKFNINIIHEPTANKNSYRIANAWLTIQVIAEIMQIDIPKDTLEVWNSIPEDTLEVWNSIPEEVIERKVLPTRRKGSSPTLGVDFNANSKCNE